MPFEASVPKQNNLASIAWDAVVSCCEDVPMRDLAGCDDARACEYATRNVRCPDDVHACVYHGVADVIVTSTYAVLRSVTTHVNGVDVTTDAQNDATLPPSVPSKASNMESQRLNTSASRACTFSSAFPLARSAPAEVLMSVAPMLNPPRILRQSRDSAKDVLKDSLQDLMVMCQHVRGTFDTAVSDFQQNKTAEGVDIDLNKKKSIPLHVFPSSLERSDMESSDGTLVYSRTSVVESYGKGSDASSTASVQSGFDNGQEFGKRLRARSLLYHQVKLMVGLVKSVGTGDLTTADVTDAPPMAHLLVVSTLPT
ncbi:hypothetical protein GUJ93_ZPchr0009g2263 [Zizania palustris]|uniref:Uncharacterized protein n=1 Tax=Zizania palustris TaxID=103762 RepID=A0A8J5RC83_ZIZPA|nr:hypothetical protein GUJ93_ZPchr0009g2263 [Zizania palustris]